MKIIEKRVGIEIKRKKEHSLFWILLISIIVLCIASVVIERSIYHHIANLDNLGDIESSGLSDIETAWVGSAASYWGGVIGGLFSGSLAFVGVVFTIQYYKKQAEKDKRNENMPFLEAQVTHVEHRSTVDLTKNSYLIVDPQRKAEPSEGGYALLNIKIENIGKGFAHTLAIYTGENDGGKAYHKLFKINETDEMLLKFYLVDLKESSRISFSLQYIDCMTNEYIQEFDIIRLKRSKYTIDCGYPNFLGQIH